jgi:hypothetical protein
MSIPKIREVFRREGASFTDPELVQLFLDQVALRGRGSETATSSEDAAELMVARL